MRTLALALSCAGSPVAGLWASVASGAEVGAAVAPASLRDTGFFVEGSAPGGSQRLAFSPQYPLWSDGATKRRWVQIPAGQAIDATQADAWVFPVGTRFWKEFRVGDRKVETRFIDRLPDGQWRFTAYVWNAAGTDAVRAPAGGVTLDLEIAPGKRYVVPAEGDCRSCHEGRSTPVLGFSALQLSPDRDPAAPHAEAGGLDLRDFAARGLLRGLSPALLARPPRVATTTATARAALGYLAANCGICHNAEGPLAGLEMTLDPGTGAARGARDVLDSTVGRISRFFPPGATGDPVRITPGRPDLSVLVTRMRSRDPLLQMPPLGSQIVDAAGVALIERWISETQFATPQPQEIGQ